MSQLDTVSKPKQQQNINTQPIQADLGIALTEMPITSAPAAPQLSLLSHPHIGQIQRQQLAQQMGQKYGNLNFQQNIPSLAQKTNASFIQRNLKPETESEIPVPSSMADTINYQTEDNEPDRLDKDILQSSSYADESPLMESPIQDSVKNNNSLEQQPTKNTTIENPSIENINTTQEVTTETDLFANEPAVDAEEEINLEAPYIDPSSDYVALLNNLASVEFQDEETASAELQAEMTTAFEMQQADLMANLPDISAPVGLVPTGEQVQESDLQAEKEQNQASIAEKQTDIATGLVPDYGTTPPTKEVVEQSLGSDETKQEDVPSGNSPTVPQTGSTDPKRVTEGHQQTKNILSSSHNKATELLDNLPPREMSPTLPTKPLAVETPDVAPVDLANGQPPSLDSTLEGIKLDNLQTLTNIGEDMPDISTNVPFENLPPIEATKAPSSSANQTDLVIQRQEGDDDSSSLMCFPTDMSPITTPITLQATQTQNQLQSVAQNQQDTINQCIADTQNYQQNIGATTTQQRDDTLQNATSANQNTVDETGTLADTEQLTTEQQIIKIVTDTNLAVQQTITQAQTDISNAEQQAQQDISAEESKEEPDAGTIAQIRSQLATEKARITQQMKTDVEQLISTAQTNIEGLIGDLDFTLQGLANAALMRLSLTNQMATIQINQIEQEGIILINNSAQLLQDDTLNVLQQGATFFDTILQNQLYYGANNATFNLFQDPLTGTVSGQASFGSLMQDSFSQGGLGMSVAYNAQNSPYLGNTPYGAGPGNSFDPLGMGGMYNQPNPFNVPGLQSPYNMPGGGYFLPGMGSQPGMGLDQTGNPMIGSPWLNSVAGQAGNMYTGRTLFKESVNAGRILNGGFNLSPGSTYAGQYIVNGSQESLGLAGLNPNLRHARGLTHAGLRPYISPAAAARSSIFSKGTAIGAGITIGADVYDYGWGAHSDDGLASTEFASALTWDLGTGVGLPAAGAAIGTAIAPGPGTLIGGAVGTGISLGLNLWPGVRDWGVDTVNSVYEGAVGLSESTYEGVIDLFTGDDEVDNASTEPTSTPTPYSTNGATQTPVSTPTPTNGTTPTPVPVPVPTPQPSQVVDEEP